jgi:hypothetical protein
LHKPRLLKASRAVTVIGKLVFVTEVAAQENGTAPLNVRDHHLDEGLADLLVAGGPLTKSLLGAVGLS